MSAFYDQASLVVVPSGYKSGKIYAQKPLTTDGQLTFTRASTATRVNASGLIETVASNVPRLDYSGGATCPRLLLEPQRTNLAFYSEQFDNAFWTKGNFSTISANATTSPDGTLSADKHVSANSTAAFALGWVNASVVSGTVYTFSVYLKRSEVRFVQLRNNISGNLFCNFDLELGVAGTPSAGLTASISNAGSGWYRCVITATSGGTATAGFLMNMVNSITDGLAQGIIGNGVNGYFVWGAQVEVGSFVSSYIPTTTAAVTRLAENCNKTSISSLIGQTEGTMFLDFIFKTPSVGTHGQMGISSPTSPGDRLIIWNNITLNTLAVTLQLNNLSIFTTSLGTFVDGQRYKIALAYKSGSNAAYVNGAQAFTNSTTFTFNYTITDFILGAYAVTAMPAHQLTNQAALFPTRLTNAQLAELTTL
jgi:hypothetical protein